MIMRDFEVYDKEWFCPPDEILTFGEHRLILLTEDGGCKRCLHPQCFRRPSWESRVVTGSQQANMLPAKLYSLAQTGMI